MNVGGKFRIEDVLAPIFQAMKLDGWETIDDLLENLEAAGHKKQAATAAFANGLVGLNSHPS